MKLLNQEIQKIFSENIKFEEYDLNNIYSKDIKNKSLIICYLLATKTSLVTIELKPKNEEIGVPLEWYRHYDQNSFKETFSSLYGFLIEFDYGDLGVWHFNIMYKDVEVDIGGNRNSSIIRLSYDCDGNETFDISPLLKQVEEESKKYK